MKQRFQRVGITARSDMQRRDEVIPHIVRILQSCGADVLVERPRCDIQALAHLPSFQSISDIDLLVVVGGDGTILRAVREYAPVTVPILSINRGTVGFLAELSLHECEKALPAFLEGTSSRDERRTMLDVHAMRGETTLFRGHVLNEATISQGALARIIDLQTTVDGQPLTTLHADGVILATPTGSTAYSLAAGGPIVHPDLPAMILTPINAYSFSQKPLVIPAKQRVQITIATKQSKFDDVQVSLTLDGQSYVPLGRGDVVEITGSAHCLHFLRRTEESFYGTLREKLRWGDSARERA